MHIHFKMGQLEIQGNLLRNMHRLSQAYMSSIDGNKSTITYLEKEVIPKLKSWGLPDKGYKAIVPGTLRLHKSVPELVRQQLVVSLTGFFEVFINDTLKEIYLSNPSTLKSQNKTLNDEDIIEAITNDNIIEKLIEVKLRGVMYGNFENWIKYINHNFGFNFRSPNEISELFQVRNCIVHNDCKVSRELALKFRTRKYVLEKEINITEKDYKKYFEAIFDYSKKITSDVIKKYSKKKVRNEEFGQHFFAESYKSRNER